MTDREIRVHRLERPGVAARRLRLTDGRGRLVLGQRGHGNRTTIPTRPRQCRPPQLLHEISARRKAILRIARQRPCDDRPIGDRRRRQIVRVLHVLQNQLLHRRAGERPMPRQHFLVDNRQAVLIAQSAELAVKGLGSGVDRRDPARDRHQLHAVRRIFHQPEVGDLDVVENEEQILRLDVEMLELELDVHQVEHFRGLGHIAEQLLARDAGVALRAALLEAVSQRAIRQLHDDDEVIIDVFITIEQEDERMAHRLDADQRFPFLIGTGTVRLGADRFFGRCFALHELDCFE